MIVFLYKSNKKGRFCGVYVLVGSLRLSKQHPYPTLNPEPETLNPKP